jgi:hypothetical protein
MTHSLAALVKIRIILRISFSRRSGITLPRFGVSSTSKREANLTKALSGRWLRRSARAKRRGRTSRRRERIQETTDLLASKRIIFDSCKFRAILEEMAIFLAKETAGGALSKGIEEPGGGFFSAERCTIVVRVRETTKGRISRRASTQGRILDNATRLDTQFRRANPIGVLLKSQK